MNGLLITRLKVAPFIAMLGTLCIAQGAAHPATGGTFEPNAIAGGALGRDLNVGDVGRIFGTILGAFVIGILSDGQISVGDSSF